MTEFSEFWHVMVSLPEYNKVDSYYFDTKRNVLSSIHTTYSKCPPEMIQTTITDDNITVSEEALGIVIVANRVFVPRDIRTQPDHF